MDRAPLSPTEFAALRRGSPTPIPPAQAAALRRAAELTVELTAVVASVRAHVAQLQAVRSAAPSPSPALTEPPEVEPRVEPLARAPADEDGALEPGALRAAFGAAQAATPSRPRPRWADSLLGDE